MSEPRYLSGDTATFADTQDGTQEVECDCGWIGEVGTTEDYAMGIVSWFAEWKCPSCDESHTSDGEYDPSDDN
jgi:hypothetical protein